MYYLLVALAAVIVFGSVIFIHELGHFLAAKRANIKVNEFALGMGPTLVKFKKGETTYALRLLPIGGFVAMEGEDEDSPDERSFQRASIPNRILVTVAGAMMNFILGFVVLAILLATGGAMASRTVSVVESEASGLQVGDVVTHVNGRRAYVMQDLVYEFLRTPNGDIDLTVRRDGEKLVLQGVQFDIVETVDANGEPYEYMDIGFKVLPVDKTVFTVAREAFNNSLSYGRMILLSLSDLVLGRVEINQLSGPVGIVSEIGSAVSIGWDRVFSIMALITINLGIVNLLPFPALDGGRCVLLLIEGIRRKPMNQKFEIALNLAGFALLMGLMVFVSFNDIRNLIM